MRCLTSTCYLHIWCNPGDNSKQSDTLEWVYNIVLPVIRYYMPEFIPDNLLAPGYLLFSFCNANNNELLYYVMSSNDYHICSGMYLTFNVTFKII
jgi:hypothetical protein